MNRFKLFTGGALDTNAFLLETPKGNILFDAPEGADRHFADCPINCLVLTHGHYDHTADAAKIRRRHGCQVAYHPDTEPMATDPTFFRRLGFGFDVEPFCADVLLDECASTVLVGEAFRVLHVPGHCPGSICLYHAATKTLVGGDVLFAGGVGRWDLPGGDGELLFHGIRTKLFTLPDETLVLPGHGPATTIGEEKSTNPFVRP